MISAPLTTNSSVPSGLTVIVSKGQSRHPEKRQLEASIADLAAELDGVDVIVVPHLYDLPKGGPSLKALADFEGDLVCVSWIFSRAAHWVLDRNGIDGQVGFVAIHDDNASDGDALPESTSPTNRLKDQPSLSGAASAASPEASRVELTQPESDRVTDLVPRRERQIHCIDLKAVSDVSTIVGEIERIRSEQNTLEAPPPNQPTLPIVVEEVTKRRWYPVIDFDRCTNCMECVDFCLFGVYGVDGVENILVEQPDNCRKGCPACSRVCPENAIIFPQHKAPAIAGAETDGDEGFKIDLSQLFGAPKSGKSDADDPIATAARERDEQLMLAGRQTIGIDDQLRQRQVAVQAGPKDSLDHLIDSLDDLDL
ncbi:MAG: ferredoxin family protein [Planctomycetota bacterium]